MNERTNERTSKYTAPPNPQGDRPRSMWSLAGINHQILPSSLDYNPWFSLSSFDGVVTLRKGLARASDVTGLVRLLVGWLESASKSQPVRSFDCLQLVGFEAL